MEQEFDQYLDEGLKRRALEDLVLPLISVDEYESKISDKRSIVVGFYVTDEDPATDLSNFIDRGHQPILDTEVSPAPTPEGQFVVFVEIERGEDFPETLCNVLEEISNVASISRWQFTCPSCKTPTDVTEENLSKNIVLDPTDIVDIDDEEADEETDVEPAQTDLKEQQEFWKDACVERFEINDGPCVVLYEGGRAHCFSIEDCDAGGPDSLVFGQESKLLESMLGTSYQVLESQDLFLISNGNRTVLVKKLG